MTKPEDWEETKEFYYVLTKCIEAAKKGETITYKEVGKLMDLSPLRGNKFAKDTGAMAGAISKEMKKMVILCLVLS